jgi:soluble lytic murein transglycosylase-like protein
VPQPRLETTKKLRPIRTGSSSFPAIAATSHGQLAALRSPRWAWFLCGGIATVVLVGGGAANAQPIAAAPDSAATLADRFADFVTEASQRFGIPASWIRAVMHVESLGNARATSPKGAIGLMQIMPQTWAGLRLRYGLGADPYDIHDNILAGAAYLRELHDRYGAPGFLAAYNAGPARYEDHLATGRPLPAETRSYVAVIAPLIGAGQTDRPMNVAAVVRSWTQAPLFAARPESSQATSQAPAGSQAKTPLTESVAQDWTTLAPQSDGLFVRASRRDPHP